VALSTINQIKSICLGSNTTQEGSWRNMYLVHDVCMLNTTFSVLNCLQSCISIFYERGRRVVIVWLLDLQLPM
jgi:hypothetical protein